MPEDVPTELVLIRHAPVAGDGRMCGRRDLPADCSDTAAFARLVAQLPRPARIVHSPALRCVQTVEALWPGARKSADPSLWEQDFGEWEGLPHAALPDLGPMDRTALAAHRPPGGESFVDLCARVQPALLALRDRQPAPEPGPVAVTAHAGTVRAALALALGSVAAALAFEIAPLSLTRLSLRADGQHVIHAVNQCA
ncbi:histidine phosphatase family protein [Acidimangrovimonas pyrenivorans]|uniref:Histidine phosphatase family protein n=1 Tax=Acidimangrovimonas pyrenivorans TaxID=2030798 RepID=A0ABV7AIA7_9RHOB